MLASFKQGIQVARQQNVENLGILIINKTVVITSVYLICNSAAIRTCSEYIFIVSKILQECLDTVYRFDLYTYT